MLNKTHKKFHIVLSSSLPQPKIVVFISAVGSCEAMHTGSIFGAYLTGSLSCTMATSLRSVVKSKSGCRITRATRSSTGGNKTFSRSLVLNMPSFTVRLDNSLFPLTQCAAVTTTCGAISVAPIQKKIVRSRLHTYFTTNLGIQASVRFISRGNKKIIWTPNFKSSIVLNILLKKLGLSSWIFD